LRHFFAGEFAEDYELAVQGYAEKQLSKDFLAQALRRDLCPYAGTPGHSYLTIQHRSFFTTSEGYIGVTPAPARSGDVICVLLGGVSLLTLRKVDNNQYQVVGETYLCGMMHGKALLGPYPKEYRPIFCYQEKEKQWDCRFLNTKTGNMEVVDPRLRGLAPEEYSSTKTWHRLQSENFDSSKASRLGVNVVNFELV
jgi:hypothetical protein